MRTVPLWKAAGLASVIEALLIAGILLLLVSKIHPAIKQSFIPLVISPVEVEKPAPVVEPPPRVPEPPPVPEPVVKPKPKPVPVVQQAPAPAPAPVAKVEVPQPVTEEAVPVPSRPVVAAPVAKEVDPALAYNLALTQAVQATFRVPGTAAAMGFKGRARVQFVLVDGKVSAIALLVSSTLGAVDRAALKAVQAANYPLPPDSLKGQARTYQIWVECF